MNASNLLLTAHQMLSPEIADLVQSEPRAVNLSIERLAKRGVIQLPPLMKVENKQSISPNKFSNVYVFSGEQGNGMLNDPKNGVQNLSGNLPMNLSQEHDWIPDVDQLITKIKMAGHGNNIDLIFGLLYLKSHQQRDLSTLELKRKLRNLLSNSVAINAQTSIE